MLDINRRTLLKLIGFAATGSLVRGAGGGKLLERAQADTLENLYQLPMAGNVRILHSTDIHAQLRPVYFREANVNIGVGEAKGKANHLVEHAMLDWAGLREDSIEAYAFTSLGFEKNAREYGRMGGLAQLMTLYHSLRKQAGGIENTLTLDGGDLWQGSATALWTRGRDMVEASNLLGVDIMTGHWEFSYHQAELLSNLQEFNGEFLSQNVRIKEDSLFEDTYFDLADQFGGLGLYDEDNAIAFKPYTLRKIAGKTIAIIGQAFPRTANANPQSFFPDWTFGIREEELITLVGQIREQESPDAVLLLSHNGMDVDLKLARRVNGIDAILGGHTHDVAPIPLQVNTPDGGTCLVTNAGTNGKFTGVMDLDLGEGKVRGIQYHLLPVFEDLLEADSKMHDYISSIRSSVYGEDIVESRNQAYRFNPARTGKTFADILDEKLAIADRTLYRRGNFTGTWDQLICDALRHEYNADISLSPGFRWGTTVLAGEWITMEDIMTQTAITYGETYVQEMTGETIRTILESVADNLFDPDPYFQSGGDMVRVGGLDFTIDPTRPLLERISSAVLDSGEALAADKTYRVAGWAVVGEAPEGRLIWDIVRDYLLGQRDQDNVIRIAKVYHPVLEGVADNPGVSRYQGELVG